MLTLRTGDLAFFNGLTGLHPCRVLSVTSSEVKVQFTTGSLFPRATILETTWSRVVPRRAVSYRTAKCGRILPYRVVEDV